MGGRALSALASDSGQASVVCVESLREDAEGAFQAAAACAQAMVQSYLLKVEMGACDARQSPS